MAITATFVADFDAFNTEVKKAEAQLDLFEKETEEAGGAITKMALSTKTAAPAVSGLTSAYRQFDGVLSAAGINLGPAVKGLEDLTAAAGKSITQIGLLGTAGLVVGTFTAAFVTARSVIEKFFPDLDNWIATSVSSLMGWGDVAAQEAGAVADALALASQRADREITNQSEALRINTQFRDDLIKKGKEQVQAEEAWRKAAEEVTIASQNWTAVLNTMNPKVIEAAKYALEHGVAQTSVATAYKLSKPEMAAVIQLMDDEKKKAQDLAAQQKKWAAEQKAEWDAAFAIRDRLFGDDAIKAASDYAKAIGLLGGTIETLNADQLAELQQVMLAAIDAMARSGRLTQEQSSAFATLAVQAGAALEAMRPVVTVTEDLVQAQWDYVTALDAANTAAAGARGEIEKLTATEQAATTASRPAGGTLLLPRAIATQGGIPRDLFGRPVVPDFSIAALPHEETTATGHYPTTININSPLGTPDQIASAVGNAVTSSYKAGGKRLPA